jgi:hypothetical protein
MPANSRWDLIRGLKGSPINSSTPSFHIFPVMIAAILLYVSGWLKVWSMWYIQRNDRVIHTGGAKLPTNLFAFGVIIVVSVAHIL